MIGSVALLFQICGVALVLLSMLDVFMTVLYARAATGPLSHRLAYGSWYIARRVSRHLGSWKEGFLTLFGPAYILVQVAVWIALLIFGFTLISRPSLGIGVQSQSGPTPTDFATAFYYAGGSLTTVGSGDLRPVTPFFKYISVIDSLLGISILTLALTYVIQIYAALMSRNALVLSLDQASGGTSDATVILVGLGPDNDFSHSDSALSSFASQVTSTYEAQHFYPVLIYFRFREPYYALSRGALLLMDLISLIESALSERHGWLAQSAALVQIRQGKTQVLSEFARLYLPNHWQDSIHGTED